MDGWMDGHLRVSLDGWKETMAAPTEVHGNNNTPPAKLLQSGNKNLYYGIQMVRHIAR